MKKNYFFTALALCGLLTFTSCGNDDDPISEGPNTEIAAGDQVIVLDMQDTDVLSTKSRPLLSATNQGSEKVTDVKLLVFATKDNTGKDITPKYLKTIYIPNWDQVSNDRDYDYGRKYTLKLKGDDKIKIAEAKEVTIIAVGQDESNQTATPAPFEIGAKGSTGEKFISADWKTWITGNPTTNFGSAAGEGFLFTKVRGGKDAKQPVAEIFSGTSEPVQIGLEGGFSATVLLKRQVAGMIGYFNRIPAEVNGNAVTNIRLVASVENKQIDLVHALDDQVDDTTNGKKLENVVNGFNPSNNTTDNNGVAFMNGTVGYQVYNIDLTQWYEKAAGEATNGADAYWGDAAGTDTENGNVKILGLGDKAKAKWKNPLSVSNTLPRVETGSVLAGEFVIPFNRIVAANTLELQLLSGDAVVKSWAIKLDPNSQSDKDSDKSYNIYRNHLYQIGDRKGGDSPVDPGTDPDKPQPLDKDQELLIKINDQWEFIHSMELD